LGGSNSREIVPLPIAHQRRLYFSKDSKAVDGACLEFFESDIVERWTIITGQVEVIRVNEQDGMKLILTS
jgi:hypothetical protein